MNDYANQGSWESEQHVGPVGAAARSVRDGAAGGAHVVADQAGEVAGTVEEQAARVAQEALAQARDLLDEARGQVRGQAREQTERLAENVRRLAAELREMAAHGKPDSTAAVAVAQLADGGQRVADRLQRRGPDGLLEDVQDFARRRPGLFLAGAALAGFALGRAGKGVAAADGPSEHGHDGHDGQDGQEGLGGHDERDGAWPDRPGVVTAPVSAPPTVPPAVPGTSDPYGTAPAYRPNPGRSPEPGPVGGTGHVEDPRHGQLQGPLPGREQGRDQGWEQGRDHGWEQGGEQAPFHGLGQQPPARGV
ncbi:hypothetical protein GCM10009759_09550 [Kitasatospora saccharophila]|uniref:Uncharacterized protein n=1 Tax=Kitasatospora saccharophila TaxID=407973 RepID=A0ABN2WBP6_9ACTN